MAGGAKTFRDAILPALDACRGIPGLLGLRLYTVAVVSRTWTGARPGIGIKHDATTGVKTDLGLFPVKVTLVSATEIVASAGLYVQNDIRVGPITPPYAGSALDGNAISVFDPPVGSTGFELFFKVTGPQFPTGAWFSKVSTDTYKSLRYTFVLRSTGKTP